MEKGAKVSSIEINRDPVPQSLTNMCRNTRLVTRKKTVEPPTAALALGSFKAATFIWAWVSLRGVTRVCAPWRGAVGAQRRWGQWGARCVCLVRARPRRQRAASARCPLG